ncbi:hypothetical protein [Massilia glaciei]|uniref:hypothetical protein n=1 Tax=Massilia glaciei TaxID=1524097 RepID=UPI0011B23C1F|nr:hypothetical protein [Massilia glaciei]
MFVPVSLAIALAACKPKTVPAPRSTICNDLAEQKGREASAGAVGASRLYDTVAGTQVAVPMSVGAAGPPDEQCKVAGINLQFFWHGAADGKLMSQQAWERQRARATDAVAGHNARPSDPMVEFFGYFVPPSSAKPGAEPDKWTSAKPHRLQGHPELVVYPVADWPGPGFGTATLDDPGSWRPQFEFRGLLDGWKRPVFFSCSGIGLRFAGEGIVALAHEIPEGMTCLAYFSVSETSGGHIRVRDRAFLSRGEAIIKAVIAEVNSYTVPAK